MLFLVTVAGYSQNKINSNTRSVQYQLFVNYVIDKQSLDYFKEPITNGLINTTLSNDARYVTNTYKLADDDKLLVSKGFINDRVEQVIFVIIPELTNGNITFNTYSHLINYFNKTYSVQQVSKNWNRGLLNIEMQLQDDGIAILIISYI
ncbi:hypothetical protein [Myroides pelagicus]|uniref:hypothetical protein n=1 Tax=Myroides pelagicus TaxID=270914 RepID=UPI001396B200